MQNGNPIDFLGSVEMFTEAMSEHYGNSKNSLFIIVSDGNQSLLCSFGQDDEHIDAMSTVIYQNEEVKHIIQNALALAIAAQYNSQDHDTD